MNPRDTSDEVVRQLQLHGLVALDLMSGPKLAARLRPLLADPGRVALMLAELDGHGITLVGRRERDGWISWRAKVAAAMRDAVSTLNPLTIRSAANASDAILAILATDGPATAAELHTLVVEAGFPVKLLSVRDALCRLANQKRVIAGERRKEGNRYPARVWRLA